jgi:23S rRNA-/tRNA-specific pseudouridylate synthase
MANSIPSDLVIFADEAILVINKPAGMLSLQDGYDHTLPHVSTILSPSFGRIWMVHRLDRETSGVMVVARSAQAHHDLNDQFKHRQVNKTYHCLAWGAPKWDEKDVEVPLKCWKDTGG